MASTVAVVVAAVAVAATPGGRHCHDTHTRDDGGDSVVEFQIITTIWGSLRLLDLMCRKRKAIPNRGFVSCCKDISEPEPQAKDEPQAAGLVTSASSGRRGASEEPAAGYAYVRCELAPDFIPEPQT